MSGCSEINLKMDSALGSATLLGCAQRGFRVSWAAGFVVSVTRSRMGLSCTFLGSCYVHNPEFRQDLLGFHLSL
jgi:hypothetical protein